MTVLQRLYTRASASVVGMISNVRDWVRAHTQWRREAKHDVPVSTVVAFRQPVPPRPTPAPTPAQTVIEPVAAPTPAVAPPKYQGRTISDRERRRLERLRRKHDKFVTPQGPEPIHRPRDHTQPQPTQPAVPEIEETPAIAHDPNDRVLADKHHEDRQGEHVLYEETELWGEFNFRDTILQQLECYFIYLDRMKKRDPDSYEFYKQVGATVVPYVANNSHDRNYKPSKKEGVREFYEPSDLPAWFKQTRPAFGCFVYGADPETEKFELTKHPSAKVIEAAFPGEKVEPKTVTWWVPKFMYFTKYSKPPPELQMISGGDIYKMTVWWDRPFDPKYKKKLKQGYPQEFGVFISADGTKVTVLRQIETKMVSIYSKRKHESFHVPQRLWQIPNDYELWAKQHGTNAQKHLSGMFIEAVRRLEFAQYSMVRVAVTKNDMTAVFGVNVRRTAYFFQDRDIHLTEDGTRKHIFHMVRAHVRRDGSQVPFHFRGERDFTWAGYKVSITVPGRDHFMLDEFNAGAEDEYWVKKSERKGLMHVPEVGKLLADNIKKGLGGHHR